MKLIVISSSDSHREEHLLIEYMLDLGLEHFHVRKPSYTKEQIRTFIERIPFKYRDRISLHAHHDLVMELGFCSVHFTRQFPETYDKLRWNCKKTISCHHMDELENLEPEIEYAFLSPVFDSISKVGHNGNFDIDQLSVAISSLETKASIIALGGVDENQISICREIGFEGVAVLGAIWETLKRSGLPQAMEKFKSIQSECKNIRQFV